MKTKKIVGLILRIPLYVLVLGSFAASIYAAYAKIQGVTYVTPIILGAIIVAFIIGCYLKREPKEEYQDEGNQGNLQ
jgi:uncharacterized membrane protein YoaK (UPF0700 family)